MSFICQLILTISLRQKYVLPHKSFLSCKIVPYSVIVVQDIGAAQICGSGNRRTSRTSADHLGFQVVDRHSFSPSFLPYFFVSFSQKENGCRRRSDTHNSEKHQVDVFHWQLAQGRVQNVPLLTNAKAGVLAITAWTMTAAPQSCGIVHEAPVGAASASQSARLPQAIPPPLRGGE